MYASTIDKVRLDECPPILTSQGPAEYLGNAYDDGLHLVSPQSTHRLHSQIANAEPVPKLDSAHDRKPALVNAECAQARDI